MSLLAADGAELSALYLLLLRPFVFVFVFVFAFAFVFVFVFVFVFGTETLFVCHCWQQTERNSAHSTDIIFAFVEATFLFVSYL